MFEAFYSAPFTDECYQNFRAQQGLFVELKDFASYLENEILGNDKISIELSSIGELPISKQVRFKNLRKLDLFLRINCHFAPHFWESKF